jgi:hypothetical protein
MRLYTCALTVLLGLPMWGCSGERAMPAAPTPLPAPPPAGTASVDGVWILDNPAPGGGQPTTLTLVQLGSDVTGTAVRVAPFVVSETGSVTGAVTGTTFNLTWVNVVDFANPGSCNPSTTTITGAITVGLYSMAGFLAPRGGTCAGSRVPAGNYTFTRQEFPLPPQRPPVPIILAVTYRPAPFPAHQTDTGCTHHYGPGNRFFNIDGVVSAMPTFAADGLFHATIRGAWPGEHRVSLYDTNLCPPNGTTNWGTAPFVTSGVSINGVQLTRVVLFRSPDVAGQPPAASFPVMPFSLAADGSVQP